MKLYADPSVTRDALDQIASGLGIQVYEYDFLGQRVRGKYSGRVVHKFVLRPDDKTGAKPQEQRFRKINDNPFAHSGNGRRAAWAVCFHGHWHFMRAVFDIDPAATFVTGFDTWDGEADFMERAEQSGMRNVGSIMYPLQYREACNCDMTGDYILGSGRPEPRLWQPDRTEGGMAVYTMPQSMMRACPHCIMVPEHYRENGTCRCDDPTHIVMADWEYKWNGVQWVGIDYNNEEE